jgi:integrase/recombinase XerD
LPRRGFCETQKIDDQAGSGTGPDLQRRLCDEKFSYLLPELSVLHLESKPNKAAKRVRREVIFRTKEEIETFLGTISGSTLTDLRFRAIVETILGTGMRIGEILSLKRKDINWKKKEAKIVGKGNKERTVFFTDRALEWIRKYLEARHDHCDAVFVTNGDPRKSINSRRHVAVFQKASRKGENIEEADTAHPAPYRGHQPGFQRLPNCPR